MECHRGDFNTAAWRGPGRGRRGAAAGGPGGAGNEDTSWLDLQGQRKNHFLPQSRPGVRRRVASGEGPEQCHCFSCTARHQTLFRCPVLQQGPQAWLSPAWRKAHSSERSFNSYRHPVRAKAQRTQLLRSPLTPSSYTGVSIDALYHIVGRKN